MLILNGGLFLFIGYVSLSSEEFDGLILLFGGVWNAHKKKN